MCPGKCSGSSGTMPFLQKRVRQRSELYEQEKEAGRPFDLVILDLAIPVGMGGRETMEKLISYDPDVKAVVSSGYTNDPVMQDFARFGFSGRLTKPYRINDMKTMLEEMIPQS